MKEVADSGGDNRWTSCLYLQVGRGVTTSIDATRTFEASLLASSDGEVRGPACAPALLTWYKVLRFSAADAEYSGREALGLPEV